MRKASFLIAPAIALLFAGCGDSGGPIVSKDAPAASAAPAAPSAPSVKIQGKSRPVKAGAPVGSVGEPAQ